MSANTLNVRPKNWMTPVVLVLLREESSHGYELIDRIGEFGFEQMNPGTLYRTLRKMENEGLCKSEWQAPKGGGAPCRVYSVTDAGEDYLES